MNTYKIVDENTDKVLAYVDADSVAEAYQFGVEYVAESGRDRELDYDGFYVL